MPPAHSHSSHSAETANSRSCAMSGCAGTLLTRRWRSPRSVPSNPAKWLSSSLPGAPFPRFNDTLDSLLIPAAWHGQFPIAQELVAESVRRVPDDGSGIDRLLIRRRDTEFDLFRQLEDAVALPRIREGFHSLDEFIQFAGSLTNRRKARSGRSLELQVVELLQRQGVHFEHGAVIEGGKRPDFLFPSVRAYEDPSTPAEQTVDARGQDHLQGSLETDPQ